jgi:hypothetical protein
LLVLGFIPYDSYNELFNVTRVNYHNIINISHNIMYFLSLVHRRNNLFVG